LRRLPDDDLFWLSDTGSRALVPVHGSSGELQAMIVLGPTRSEEDLAEAHGSLIAALGAGFSAPLERLARTDSEDRPASDARAAQECAGCGRVAGAGADACPHCGGSLATAAVPQMLAGKFVAERVIGHGGMGVVYRALDTTLGRSVAIKTLPRVSMEQVVRLRREARTMATFTHPNLATLFGLETWRGTPMLIVEYLDGGTLADRLHRGPLSWDEWLPVGVSILDALAHIHERGVLHRDLKPSNIGFNSAGAPKLLDFGLAELVDGITTAGAPVASTPYAALLSDRRIGTPVYMSPEAARGETPGTHFDLWSFAVVMLEALSGRLLYPTAEAAIRDLPSATIPDWRASAHLPAEVTALLDAALAPDSTRRPQSAGEFKQRLGAIAPTGRR
jgi:serine/threonine protein kinase